MKKNLGKKNKVVSEREYENLYKDKISESEKREIVLEVACETTRSLHKSISSRMDQNLYDIFFNKTSLSIASSITVLMRDFTYTRDVNKEDFSLLAIVSTLAIEMEKAALKDKYNHIYKFLGEKFSKGVDYADFLNFYYDLMDDIGASRDFVELLIKHIDERSEYIYGHIEDIYFYNTRNLALDEEVYLEKFKLEAKSVSRVEDAYYDVKWKGYILKDISEKSLKNVKQPIAIKDNVNQGDSLFYISNYTCPHCHNLLYNISTDDLSANIEDDKNTFNLSAVYTCTDCKKFYGSIWEYGENFFRRKPLKDFGIESLSYEYMDYYHTLSRVQNFARVDSSRVRI